MCKGLGRLFQLISGYLKSYTKVIEMLIMKNDVLIETNSSVLFME